MPSRFSRCRFILFFLILLLCGFVSVLPGQPSPTPGAAEGSVEVLVPLPSDLVRAVAAVILATVILVALPSVNTAIVVAASIITIESLFPAAQPTEPKKVLIAPTSSSAPATLVPSDSFWESDSLAERGLFVGKNVRAYVLNTALSQLTSGGQRIQAPNFVDFVNLVDSSYDARVSIDQPSDSFYEPQDMALTNDGRFLVVVSRGADHVFFPDRNPPSHLTIIDTQTAQVLRRIPLAATDWPSALTLSPDGRHAYVSSPQRTDRFIDGGAVVVVDIASNAVVDRLTLPFVGGVGPKEIVITPDGKLLLVLNGLGFVGATSRPGIVVIDTRTRTQITTIGGIQDLETARAIQEMTQLAIHPTGSTLYVGDVRTPQSPSDFETVGFAVIDVATGRLIRLVPVPGARNAGIDDLQVSSDGRFITHADGVTGTITILDAATCEILRQGDFGNAVLTSVAVGP